jgi:hypothetical protein
LRLGVKFIFYHYVLSGYHYFFKLLNIQIYASKSFISDSTRLAIQKRYSIFSNMNIFFYFSTLKKLRMFHFGIFTTSAPYIIMVLAYILLFTTNTLNNKCINGPFVFHINEDQHEAELYQKNQKSNKPGSSQYHYENKNSYLKRFKYPPPVLYDQKRPKRPFIYCFPSCQYQLSAFFSRPPPNRLMT